MLEWEQQHLRGALYAQDTPVVEACLAHLNQQLGGMGGDDDDHPSIALVSVFCDVLAAGAVYATQINAHANIEALVARLSKHAAAAIASMGGCDALHATYATDSAAVRATLPKYPIKGQRNVLITRCEENGVTLCDEDVYTCTPSHPRYHIPPHSIP